MCLQAVIDFSPGNGIRAALAIERGIPYLGICSNQAHIAYVNACLHKLLFRDYNCSRPCFVSDLKPFAKWTIPEIQAELKSITKQDLVGFGGLRSGDLFFFDW